MDEKKKAHDEDLVLAAKVELDEAIRIAFERAYPNMPWGVGADKWLCQVLNLDGWIAGFEKFLTACSLSFADFERIKRIGVNHYLLNASRHHGKTSVNLLGSRWKVSGDAKAEIVDGAGKKVAEIPKGDGVIVMDTSSDLWDDLAECYRQCSERVTKGNEKWFTYFRLGAITAVCVLESYINKLADGYLSRTPHPEKAVLEEMRGNPNAPKVSLREKLKDWSKIFARADFPDTGGLWDDGLWPEIEALISLRDNFVHNKRRVAALPPGNVALPAVKAFAVAVSKAIHRIGKATEGIPDWIRRNREAYEPQKPGP